LLSTDSVSAVSDLLLHHRFRQFEFAVEQQVARGDLIFTSSLIPAFSPRRRRIVRCPSKKPGAGFAERTFAKPKPAGSRFLSWGRG
jgi:hypothetical protein